MNAINPDNFIGRLERAEQPIDLAPAGPPRLRWHAKPDDILRDLVEDGRPLVLWGRSASSGHVGAIAAVRNLFNAAITLWDRAGLDVLSCLPQSDVLVQQIAHADAVEGECDRLSGTNSNSSATRVWRRESAYPAVTLALSTGPTRRTGTDGMPLRVLHDLLHASPTPPAGLVMRGPDLRSPTTRTDLAQVWDDLAALQQTRGLWVCNDRQGLINFCDAR